MSIKQENVSSPAELDKEVTRYLGYGFTIINRTDTRATLQKHKKPLSAGVIIVCLLIPVLGWLYLIMYLVMQALKAEARVVEINLVQSKGVA